MRTRKEELEQFFARTGLAMPSALPAREAIHYFVYHGNGLCGATVEERIAALKEVSGQYVGKWMRHKMSVSPIRYLVTAVLPKTYHEIERSKISRAAGVHKSEISPFKVCVKTSRYARAHTMSLDMLVLTEDSEP